MNRGVAVFGINGRQVDFAILGSVMNFKDSNRGVFEAICGIKCTLENNHAVALCLHCVVDGYHDHVVLDERGKAIPPPKRKNQAIDLPRIYLSQEKSSKFHSYWKMHHGRHSLRDLLPGKAPKKLLPSAIPAPLVSAVSQVHEWVLMEL